MDSGNLQIKKVQLSMLRRFLKSRPDVGEVHQADKGGKNTRRTSW